MKLRLAPSAILSSAISQVAVVGALSYFLLTLSPYISNLRSRALVPVALLPLLVLALAAPSLLVVAFPVVLLNTGSDWRAFGFSGLELVGFAMIGLAGLGVITRRYSLPRSSVYLPFISFLLITSVYRLAFPRHLETAQLWSGATSGFAVYVGAAVLLRSRKVIPGLVAGLAVACLLLLVQMLAAAASLPVFDPVQLGRGFVNGLLGTFTTWQINQMVPILLMCGMFFPDRRIRWLAGAGLAAAVILDTMSLSRAGLLDLVIVIVLATPYVLSKRAPRSARLLFLLPIPFVWLYGALSQVDLVSYMQRSMQYDFATGTSRIDYFLEGWRLFLSYPLTGSLLALGFSPARGHSGWGALAGDYGLLMLSVAFALFGGVLRDAYIVSRREDDPALAAVGRGLLLGAVLACIQMFYNPVIYTKSYCMMFWLLRGAAAACRNMGEQEGASHTGGELRSSPAQG